MSDRTPEQQAIIDKLQDIDGYADPYNDEACVDGWFTAAQLRRIADVMDELKAL